MLNKKILLFASLAVLLMSCQRPLASGKSWSNYKITRLIRKNVNENPYVFGNIYVKDETGIHKWPGPTIRVEDEHFFITTGVDGSYQYSLSPGRHELIAGQVGFFKVKINQLTLQRGDSVRIDFLLHVDMKANIY